jgi:general secretion pathway protein A
VAATCHIGPLDADETRAYVEHRLKCAGSTGKPHFDAAAFGGIYRASQGIPRRINAVCDRVLLAGFLGGKTSLTGADVAEVVQEFEQEAAVPQRGPVLANGSVNGSTNGSGGHHAEPTMPGGLAGAALDVDVSKLRLDPDEAEGLNRQLAALTADQRGDQLQRLERSMLRLERINLQTLATLQKLVNAVKKPEIRIDAMLEPRAEPKAEQRPPELPAK